MDYLFDTVGLCSADIDSFDETYKLLKSKFNLELTGNINFHLEDFEVFRTHADVKLRGSYVIKNARTNCYVLFVEIHDLLKRNSKMSTGFYDYYECQTWALAY